MAKDSATKLCLILLSVELMSCVAGSALELAGLAAAALSKGNSDAMDVTDFSVYYNIKNNQPIRNVLPRPWYKPGWMLRLPFAGGPCSCEGLSCSCCAGIRLLAVNFDRQACANLEFDPTDSQIQMNVTMNGESLIKNIFSTSNPPPFCVPIPTPYLPPGFMDLCVRLFDITVMDEKLHMCMDWDTRVDKAPVLVLHFDCMDMGLSGVNLTKPGGSSTGNHTISSSSSSSTSQSLNLEEPQQLDSDVYDAVTEDAIETSSYPFPNAIKYI